MRRLSPQLSLLIQHYNAHNRSEGKSPKTVGWYQEVLDLFLRWLDDNGHMNVAYYVLAFDHACDDFLDTIGMTDAYRARSGGTTFAAELHITYQREVVAGDPLRFTSQLLGCEEKRIHFILHM